MAISCSLIFIPSHAQLATMYGLEVRAARIRSLVSQCASASQPMKMHQLIINTGQVVPDLAYILTIRELIEGLSEAVILLNAKIILSAFFDIRSLSFNDLDCTRCM